MRVAFSAPSPPITIIVFVDWCAAIDMVDIDYCIVLLRDLEQHVLTDTSPREDDMSMGTIGCPIGAHCEVPTHQCTIPRPTRRMNYDNNKKGSQRRDSAFGRLA